MLYIRQNATHKIPIGPCVAVGDGFTPVTTLALGTADEAEVILHDNATVVDISAYTFAAITTADGWYHLTLQTGISGTVGQMTVVINDDSLCLPLCAHFTVVEEAVYDMLYASGADGDNATIDTIASDLVEIYSDTTAVHSQTTVIESDSIIVESSVQAVEAWGDPSSDLAAIESELIVVHSDTSAIHSQTTVIESDSIIVESSVQVVESDTTRIELALVTATGALESTPSSTVLQTDLAEATNNHYNNMVFVMTSGDEAGEARRILSYTGATGTVTLSTALSGAPTAAETFAILNIPVLGEPSEFASVVSDLVVVESDSIVTESNTQAIHSQTTVIESDSIIVESSVQVVEAWGMSATASDVAAIHSQTTVIESDSIIIESSIQVVESESTVIQSDVALIETTRSEPAQGAPGATIDFMAKIDWLYKAWRNKSDQTSTLYQLYNDDASTVDHKATVSDDATTFTKGEVVTGP